MSVHPSLRPRPIGPQLIGRREFAVPEASCNAVRGKHMDSTPVELERRHENLIRDMCDNAYTHGGRHRRYLAVDLAEREFEELRTEAIDGYEHPNEGYRLQPQYDMGEGEVYEGQAEIEAVEGYECGLCGGEAEEDQGQIVQIDGEEDVICDSCAGRVRLEMEREQWLGSDWGEDVEVEE